jgi:hypothetical protein
LGAILLSCTGVVAVGGTGLLFTLAPRTVVRALAVVSRRVYSGHYRRYLEWWDRTRPGRVQERLTGTSAIRFLDEAPSNPSAFPFYIWYVRLLGASILAIVLALLLALVVVSVGD